MSLSISSIKSMLSNLVSGISEVIMPGLKSFATGLIIAAENSLEGETGAEKRAYVVSQLDAAVELPTLLEGLDNILFGYLVDLICDRLNLLTDHDFASVTEEQAATVAATLEETDEAIEEATADAQTVDEKLAALYAKYGISSDEPDSE